MANSVSPNTVPILAAVNVTGVFASVNSYAIILETILPGLTSTFSEA
ncbi:hypothetical protein HNQ48_000046 [Melissococcus plutonius]|nr:hypothetical protein [Melissococcus plutonius]MBB5176734.1 hypothetical protein [Melissococcus plutonius]